VSNPGGARPGAGRPRKSDKHRGAIADAEQRIADRLPEIVDRLIDTALLGDTKAAIACLDRIMGKPTQAIEHSGPEGGAIPVELTQLPPGDLDALERIARRMAGLGPDGGTPGD
jgi:hypothetical protein